MDNITEEFKRELLNGNIKAKEKNGEFFIKANIRVEVKDVIDDIGWHDGSKHVSHYGKIIILVVKNMHGDIPVSEEEVRVTPGSWINIETGHKIFVDAR